MNDQAMQYDGIDEWDGDGIDETTNHTQETPKPKSVDSDLSRTKTEIFGQLRVNTCWCRSFLGVVCGFIFLFGVNRPLV